MAYSKLILSGSTDGKQILITSTTGSAPTEIHTAVAGSSAIDEVWLYAYNDSTSRLSCSIYWGGTTEPNDVIRVNLESQTRTLIMDGKLLQNGLLISAYAEAANLVSVDGFVNRISA